MQISPTEIRGTLGSVNQLFICVGILAALVAGLPLVGNPAWYVLLILYNRYSKRLNLYNRSLSYECMNRQSYHI